MAPIANPQILYKSIPQGYPVPGKDLVYDTSETIDLDTVPLNGGFLSKTIVISPEPWLRERLRDPKKPSYTTPMRLGYAVVGYGISKVLRSEDPKYSPGDYIFAVLPWKLYYVIPWEHAKVAEPGQWPDYTTDIDAVVNYGSIKIQKVPGISLTTWAASLGGPGMTAYVSLKEHVPDWKPGQTIYVSTGAGAVGLMVVQLAKLAGLKVIASTGSDEKVDYLSKEIGVNVAFNYKTTSVNDVLEKEGPLDIYWDNVGGSTLEAAIEHCRVRAKIIVCGYISEYNDQEKYGVKNLHWIFKKRLQFFGILAYDLLGKWLPSFLQEVPALIASGKIKTKEDIVYGLEKAPQAFVDLLHGKNTGKTLVVVSEDEL